VIRFAAAVTDRTAVQSNDMGWTVVSGQPAIQRIPASLVWG
jgi:hypothetical protein